MRKRKSDAEVLAVKDEDEQRPIPTAWRPVFRGAAKTAKQIKDYIDDYGETLVELPHETWASSVCIWMGTGGDVLIDLWTKGEGRSDLVLTARVAESKAGLVDWIEMVYVP